MTTKQLIHNHNLAVTLLKLGINPSRPSNIERFREWYCNRVNGVYKDDAHAMSRGYDRVANHKINKL